MVKTPQNRHPRRGVSLGIVVVAIVLFGFVTFSAYDYWSAIPESTTATYIGRGRCIECHQKQAREWNGSDHDRAMDVAKTDTVLANFDLELFRHGVSTKFWRDGERFFVRTEGHDGNPTEYEVKYVFGCQPLQQYMVETESPGDDSLGRVQVLRWSWDTERKAWFYLAPPDVDDRLLPDDPLHWTGYGQNWNHMCAECHSTNLKKNHDVNERRYHTTYSEIDVSCEACHGPGSVHAQLADARSLFWDRRRGYGLETNLKKDPISEIHSCARCHARRIRGSAEWLAGENFDDHFSTHLMTADTYYPDGQILDEVYVYGSFLQSKMYEKDIRCSDCHNVHSGQVKFTDNRLCTSCHQHTEAKYDSPAHHHHNVDSTGASCIECHMPATPYMDVDFRRDHKLGVPRPDLSVKFQTPNACTGCHLDQSGLSPARREALGHYSAWLAAARDGNEEVATALAKVDAWAAETIDQWYGSEQRDQQPTEAFYLAWRGAPEARPLIFAVASDRRRPGIIRASAVALLPQYRSTAAQEVAERCLTDREAIVRGAAASYFADAETGDRIKHLVPLLSDPVRHVRMSAAEALAAVPRSMIGSWSGKLDQALDQRRATLMVDSDLASTHISLALIAEHQRDLNRAAKHYLQAIHVQPGVAGPRTNLAALYDQMNRLDDARQLREQELPLIERDAQLAPDSDALQYRLGLYYYTLGQLDEVEPRVLAAHQLNQNNTDYVMFLALYYEKMERWDEALEMAGKLVQLDPGNPTFQQVLRSVRAKASQSN